MLFGFRIFEASLNDTLLARFVYHYYDNDNVIGGDIFEILSEIINANHENHVATT
jgi:hypothetical protein